MVNGHRGPAPVRISAVPGTSVDFDASGTTDPEDDQLTFHWWIQRDAGRCPPSVTIETGHPHSGLNIPSDAYGAEIHVICEVHDNHRIPLVSYLRLIITTPPAPSSPQ